MVIIGGGIAGLSAALELHDHGIRPAVYEAANRWGGRIFTNTGYWDGGQTSEWAGELIDSGHTTMLGQARRFRLQVNDLQKLEAQGSVDTFFFNGQFYSPADALKDFAAILPAIHADAEQSGYPMTYAKNTPAGVALDRMSVKEWIEARVRGGLTSALGQLLDVAYTTEFGADSSEQSALNLVYMLSANEESFRIFGESDERYHIQGGNQRLPLAIAEYLGSESIHLGHRLVALKKRSDGVFVLTFQHGQRTLEAVTDYLLLTLPFAVLRTLDLQGMGFDERKLLAIREQGVGRNGKLQLQFSERVWRGRGAWPGVANGGSFSSSGYQLSWDASRDQPGNLGILVNFTGGSIASALSTAVPWGTAKTPGVPEDSAKFLRQLEPVFRGATAAWQGKATSSLPHLDENLKLSYSFFRPGQYAKFAGYEGTRQGNVFFAGEHTSLDFQGFMEGGAAEGVRAATEIVQALRT
ncbi:MAG: NAD(P)/FAD-dependent oxidoreductase [Polyangiaceae bacterium]|nr:NAD(P)/FAD-dependent oxidoreductase [Polyangiaceae bacterium]